MEGAAVVGFLGRFLGVVSASEARKSDQVSAAILAVQIALHESEKYFLCIERGEARSREKEHEVSDLWIKASEPVRRVDTEFASWCRYKATYWLSRDSYAEDDIKQLNIGLENMSLRLQRLIDEN